MASRAFWIGLSSAVVGAVAFPHAVPSTWYRSDEARQAAFVAQFETLPVPPQTVVLDRYAKLDWSQVNSGDFTYFLAGRKMRTHLNIHELRRFYAPYRFKSALYTRPFDGTQDVGVEITHDGNLDKTGTPKAGGMVIRVELRDVAQAGIFTRGQCIPCGG
jgi:hypothetical protein